MKVQNYQELEVWQVAVDLVDLIFDQTEHFPKREHYGLAAHMTKTATSVPSNIAEGFGRAGIKEFIQFLYIARGSLFELETQYIITCRRKFIVNEQEIFEVKSKITSISKMLFCLIQSLQGSRQAA